MEQEVKLCEEVETVSEFTYLGDKVSAGGGCEAAVSARTRCGWVKLRLNAIMEILGHMGEMIFYVCTSYLYIDCFCVEVNFGYLHLLGLLPDFKYWYISFSLPFSLCFDRFLCCYLPINCML